MIADWPTVLALPLWAWIFVLPLILTAVFWRLRERAVPFLTPIWKVLDGTYYAFGILGSLFLIILLGLVATEMITRAMGIVFKGTHEYAAYAMAASAFFVLPHALNRGAHIRVSVLRNLNKHTEFWFDLLALVIGAIAATYMARFAFKATSQAKLFFGRTQGQDMVPNWLADWMSFFVAPNDWLATIAATKPGMQSTPEWLPMYVMCVGLTLFAICLWDNLFRLVIFGETRIKSEGIE